MKSVAKNHGVVVLGLLAIVALSYPFSTAKAYWNMDKNGNMVQIKVNANQVLGEEDNKKEDTNQEPISDQKKEDVKESENKISPSNSSSPSMVNQNEIEKVEIHKVEKESENEVTATGEGDVEINIKKLDKKELKEEQKSFEMETENGDKVHIELSPEKTQFEIRNNGVTASIDLPLSVNPSLKKLVVSTADGDKTVELMPDEIINNLKRDKQIEENSKVQINLQVENGQLVYHIEAVKHKKLIGIIPVDLTKNISVLDSTGTILSEQETILTKILSLFSI